uniref:G-protein coupled receptors family 1 profile domain-containing protein n=1 Tax=Nomascus leucogenys TaxID=61853 RepID=A0A2I3HXS5_NOMLE
MDPSIPALDTELTPINGTEETPCYKQTLSLTVLTCIISLVGLTGNAVVLWLLGCRMRRNAVSIYILNLAAADFLFPSGHVIRLSFLSSMSTERCLCVLWRTWYRCRGPTHTFQRSSSWSGGSVTSCFVMLILFGSSVGPAWSCSLGFSGSWKMPLTGLYVTILLTVLVFLLRSLSFGIQWALSTGIHLDLDVIFCRVHLVSIFLSPLNSSANPVIYFFVGSFRQHQNRQKLKLVLQRALQDMPEVDEGGWRLPEGTLELSGSRFGQ